MFVSSMARENEKNARSMGCHEEDNDVNNDDEKHSCIYNVLYMQSA
jgi:hypothetical protein